MRGSSLENLLHVDAAPATHGRRWTTRGRGPRRQPRPAQARRLRRRLRLRARAHPNLDARVLQAAAKAAWEASLAAPRPVSRRMGHTVLLRHPRLETLSHAAATLSHATVWQRRCHRLVAGADQPGTPARKRNARALEPACDSKARQRRGSCTARAHARLNQRGHGRLPLWSGWAAAHQPRQRRRRPARSAGIDVSPGPDQCRPAPKGAHRPRGRERESESERARERASERAREREGEGEGEGEIDR